jgi:hypothetical protein
MEYTDDFKLVIIFPAEIKVTFSSFTNPRLFFRNSLKHNVRYELDIFCILMW